MFKIMDPEMMNQWMGIMTDPKMMDAMMKMMDPQMMMQMMFSMMSMMNMMNEMTPDAEAGENLEYQGETKEGE